MNELDKVLDIEKQKILNEVEMIGKTILDPLGAIEKNKLPENVFVEYFLDFFKDPNKDLNSPILQQWLSIAGGPYNEVDILDHKGNIIYSVPSVYVETSIESDINNKDFQSIADEYNLKSNRLKSEADAFLSQALRGADDMVVFKTDENRKRWAMIFARYKQQSSKPKNLPPAIAESKLEDNLDDYLEY